MRQVGAPWLAEIPIGYFGTARLAASYIATYSKGSTLGCNCGEVKSRVSAPLRLDWPLDVRTQASRRESRWEGRCDVGIKSRVLWVINIQRGVRVRIRWLWNWLLEMVRA